ncbi:MAG TPA: hypothetical protein VFA81_06115 [Burkholderiales bacterium]|nr:hypothetical protein [Burkholderiales bacterium]
MITLRMILLLLLVWAAAPNQWTLAASLEKSERLVNQHDLKTTVAIGDYYLKQEAILAARDVLSKIGRAQNLGRDWNPSNPYWKQAEAAIVIKLMREVNKDFSSLEWLSEAWSQMNQAEFSEPELDMLLAHFSSEVGRKQAMIVDHTVAFHVMASLSMAGKIQEHLQGTEADRKRMQDLYNAEDDAMRFNHNENPEGTQFAFSPVGKKYFVNAVLKVSGLVSRRLYQMASQLPAHIDTSSAEVQAAVDAYRQARSAQS